MQIGVESARAVENKRIFVIEADEIIRSALQFMLHDENETHEMASLAQAYEKGCAWKPDLLLLGLSFVEEAGTGLIDEIKARLPGAAILVVADAPGHPLAEACLAAGAKGVLAKPITIEGVRGKVDIVLGRRALPIVSLDALAPAGR